MPAGTAHTRRRPRLRTIAKAMFVIPLLVSLIGFAPVAVYTGENPLVTALAMVALCYAVMLTYGLVLFAWSWIFNIRSLPFHLVMAFLPGIFLSLTLIDSLEHLDIVLAVLVFLPMLLLSVWAAAIGQTGETPAKARADKRSDKPAPELQPPPHEGLLRRDARDSPARPVNASPTVQRRRGRD